MYSADHVLISSTNSGHVNAPAPVSVNKATLPYELELCKNYTNSKKLMELQKQTVTGQGHYVDSAQAYNLRIREIVNVSIGIAGMVIVIMAHNT